VEDGLDNDEFSDEPTSDIDHPGHSRYHGGWFRGNDRVVDGARPSYAGAGRWLCGHGEGVEVLVVVSDNGNIKITLILTLSSRCIGRASDTAVMSDLSPNEGSKNIYGGGINMAYFESVIAPKVKCKNSSHMMESINNF
jgi:hypothetical protein